MFARRHVQGLAAAAMFGAGFLSTAALAQSADAPENICSEPVSRANALQCRRAAPFLGRWTNMRYGGEIEVILTSGGTLTGTIVSGNRVMRENGYGPGTQVLRGWRLTPTGGTWQASATKGASYSAIKPGRRPGEIFGTPAWGTGGVLYIAKALPNQLGMPAVLEGRISAYQPWVRRIDQASR